MFLAMALGMMCCSSQSLSVGEIKSHEYDIESRFVNMNLASHYDDVASEHGMLGESAKLMKTLQNNVQGPMSGLVKGLIQGKYTHLTEHISKQANFFLWMSPSHSTMRLIRPQKSTIEMQ